VTLILTFAAPNFPERDILECRAKRWMRGLHSTKTADFLFPQMTLGTEDNIRFSPGFIEYLFLSLTNATAFSPTDTLPLSQRAKLLMMIEASISLLTVALVAARAVNILS
jgi:hypothetical protein